VRAVSEQCSVCEGSLCEGNVRAVFRADQTTIEKLVFFFNSFFNANNSKKIFAYTRAITSHQ
jgi:hypothetical protein